MFKKEIKKVKQISLDVLIDKDIDGYELAEEIAKFLELNDYVILGADCQEDLTEIYKEQYKLI